MITDRLDALRHKAHSRRSWEVGFVGFSLLGALFFWFNKAIRGFSLPGDVSGVWIPFAQCVLDGGRMYICHRGNKPPVFHLVNLGFAATGEYLTFHFVAMGLANGITAILIWRFAKAYGYDRVGFLSAILFVTVMIAATSRVNPRNYANVFLLLALLTTSAGRAGVAIALGTLFSQFSAFLIPAVLWRRYTSASLDVRWFTTFVGAGLLTTLAVFGLVAALWGVDSAITGFRLSLLSSGEYVAKYTERDLSLYGAPVAWIYKFYRATTAYVWLMVFAFVGAYSIHRDQYETGEFGRMMLLGGLLLMLPLTIRTASVYLISWFPFLIPVSVIGFIELLERPVFDS